MPLPFLLAGAALAAAGYGVKKGSDAVSDFSDASDTNKRAQRIYDKANTELETAKLHAQNSLETLGTLKFEMIENSIIPFVDTFKKFKNRLKYRGVCFYVIYRHTPHYFAWF